MIDAEVEISKRFKSRDALWQRAQPVAGEVEIGERFELRDAPWQRAQPVVAEVEISKRFEFLNAVSSQNPGGNSPNPKPPRSRVVAPSTLALSILRSASANPSDILYLPSPGV